MIVCRLCGLTLDKIPDDAIQAGKLHRFADGEYHYLRMKPEHRSTSKEEYKPRSRSTTTDGNQRACGSRSDTLPKR
jgi:hypothetical protein